MNRRQRLGNCDHQHFGSLANHRCTGARDTAAETSEFTKFRRALSAVASSRWCRLGSLRSSRDRAFTLGEFMLR